MPARAIQCYERVRSIIWRANLTLLPTYFRLPSRPDHLAPARHPELPPHRCTTTCGTRGPTGAVQVRFGHPGWRPSDQGHDPEDHAKIQAVGTLKVCRLHQPCVQYANTPRPAARTDAVGKPSCIALRCVLRIRNHRPTAPGSLPGSTVPDRGQKGRAGPKAHEPKQRPTENEKKKSQGAKGGGARPGH